MQDQSDGLTVSKNPTVVGYFDLIGFGSAVKSHISIAMQMLNDYQSILRQTLADMGIPNYPSPPIEQRIDSFETFLPFSDSIVITSSQPNEFVAQVSRLLMSSFLLNTGLFTGEADPKDPTKIPMKYIEKGQVTQVIVETRPVLFQGGVSYEDVEMVTLNTIMDSVQGEQKFLVGKGVVEAVALAENDHNNGPHVLCTDTFVSKLNQDSRDKYIGIHTATGIYQVYWTNSSYLDGNSIDDYRVHFDEMFDPSVTLWKAFHAMTYGKYYHGLLELIIEGTEHYFLKHPDQAAMQNHVDTKLRDAGISYAKRLTLTAP